MSTFPNPVRFASRAIKRVRKLDKFRRIYHQFSQYTMVPKETFIANLELAERITNLDGCIVECGVWRGGSIAAICEVLGTPRPYILFDSFQGLPTATEIDGSAALEWQSNRDGEHYHENCTASIDSAETAMKIAGSVNFSIYPGWFEETLPNFNPPEPIALLRLDADWYESTMLCLESLFDKVRPRGIVIIDDYYVWDGCSRAVHDYLSRHSSPERIQSHRGVCFIEKR